MNPCADMNSDDIRNSILDLITSIDNQRSAPIAIANMISNKESSLFSLLLRKSNIDPRTILKTSHKNCMYKTKTETIEKSFNEVSTQCQNSIKTCTDGQVQVSQTNESKDTQTCYIYSPGLIKNHRSLLSPKHEYQPSKDRYELVNPYAIVDRVNQGEQFLKFLYKQNRKLDLIYTNFLKNLQKYTDNFLFCLRQEHGLYGTYRRDMIRYMIILQEHMNELRTKTNILQEANKNFALFQKHFHKIIQSKLELETFLNKHDKYQRQNFDQKQSVKYQQKFSKIYQTSYVQLKAIEQQRLLSIREQMRFAINLTMNSTNNHNLFISNNFDDLLNTWDHQHIVSLNYWSHFSHQPIISQQETSIDEIKQVANEYYNYRQTMSNSKYLTLSHIPDQLNTSDNSNKEFLKPTESITSTMTHNHV